MYPHWRYVIENTLGPMRRVITALSTATPERIDERGARYDGRRRGQRRDADRAGKRRDRHDPVVLGDAGAARRPAHLPDRRHQGLGHRRPAPLLDHDQRADAAHRAFHHRHRSERRLSRQLARGRPTAGRSRTPIASAGRISCAMSSTGAPMQADFAAGIRDVQFAEACYRSMKDGTWISLARALVTGTSAGLGRAIAVALAREGYDLALTELDAARSRTRWREPDITKRKAVPIALDLRSQDSIKAAFERATNELGDIDLLVNNAGRALLKPVVDVTDAEWDDVIDTNLKGAFFLSQLFGRACIARKPAGRHRQHGLDPRHDRHRRPLGLRHLQGRADPDDADAGDRMGRQEHPRQRHRADHGDDGIAPADAERSRQARRRRCRASRPAASPRPRKSPPPWSISRAPARPRSPATRCRSTAG